MSDTTYNGWKNYPTWNVALWLGNDQGTDEYCREMAAEARKAPSKYDTSERVYLADALKDFVCGSEEGDSMVPDLGASLAADLLGCALDGVDWFEIADAYLDD